MTRRQILSHGLIASAALLLTVAGCGQRAVRVGLADVTDLTTYAILSAVAGAPSNARGALPSQPTEPALLARGAYETVVVSADTVGFARVSNGALTERDLETVASNVAAGLTKELKREGFSARLAPFPANTSAIAASEDKPLLATLTPTTEEAGSPAERAAGKNQTFVKILLTITDPKTGTLLRQREFYSGANVKKK